MMLCDIAIYILLLTQSQIPWTISIAKKIKKRRLCMG